MPNDYASRIEYSEKYSDDTYEYRCVRAAVKNSSWGAQLTRRLRGPRHVILPKELARRVDVNRLLADSEWRALGVQQSRGWVHYAMHKCVTARRARLPPAVRAARPRGSG